VINWRPAASPQGESETRESTGRMPAWGGKLIRRALRSRLVGSTAIMTVGMTLRLFLQMLSFIIVAGSMGAGEFGAFVSVAALVNIIGAFSGWGSDQLLVRRVARMRSELPKALGSALIYLGISGPPLALLSFLLVPWLVDPSISWRIVLFVAASDIIFARLNNYAAASYQAVDRPWGTAWTSLGFTGVRVVAALIWVSVTPDHRAVSWATYYFVGSLLAALVSLWRVCRDLGYPVWQVRWSEWRDGLHFSLQMASFAAFGNTDKPVIAALSNLSTAGLYAAGFRNVDAASVPVRALMYSTYAKFFQVGAAGPKASLTLAVRLLPVGIGLGAIGSLGVAVVAPFAPQVLGHSYAGTQTVMLLLVPLPVLVAIYYLGADVLISSGYAVIRTLAQIAMPPVNIAFCAMLVPTHGAEGAALAALLTNSVLAVAVWIAAAAVGRRATPGVVSTVVSEPDGKSE
jgi:O-antigen/teichoic acid export membrane protein